MGVWSEMVLLLGRMAAPEVSAGVSVDWPVFRVRLGSSPAIPASPAGWRSMDPAIRRPARDGPRLGSVVRASRSEGSSDRPSFNRWSIVAGPTSAGPSGQNRAARSSGRNLSVVARAELLDRLLVYDRMNRELSGNSPI